MQRQECARTEVCRDRAGQRQRSAWTEVGRDRCPETDVGSDRGVQGQILRQTGMNPFSNIVFSNTNCLW